MLNVSTSADNRAAPMDASKLNKLEVPTSWCTPTPVTAPPVKPSNGANIPWMSSRDVGFSAPAFSLMVSWLSSETFPMAMR